MTRIAVISDIHGNDVALVTVLADIRRAAVDQIVCLGDAVQGGAQPAETVRRLRELACPVVMGNADAWLLTGIETGGEPVTPMQGDTSGDSSADSGIETGGEPVTPMQERVRRWSLTHLSADDKAFIASFVPTITVPLAADRTLLCFHGSPTSFDEVLLPSMPSEKVRHVLDPYAPAILSGGHTHLQQIRQLTETFFFNPGSVGVCCNYELPEESFRRNPWAEYAILSETDGVIGLEFRRVPLPMATLQQALAASDHPNAETMMREYGL